MENTINKNNKYKNSQIYKIIDIGRNECYIGSTVQPLSARMSTHRAEYKRFLRGESGTFFSSFELFKKYSLEGCIIELLENFPCDTKEQKHAREGYWIKHEDCINKRVAGRTGHEYRQDNKDILTQKKKVHYETNREHILQQQREYYQQHKDYIVERVKNYSMHNKEAIKERMKKYREDNKEHINSYKNEKHVCSACGVQYTNRHKARHEKSQKHINALTK
jgi:adenylate kinase family enzyme